MSTTTLAAPIRVDAARVHARPGLGRLVAVELRKMVDTRAGFWLQLATVAITVVAVIVRLLVGDAADHTFAAVLDVGLQAGGRPAADRRHPARHLGVVPAHRDDHLRAGPGALARPRRQAAREPHPHRRRCSSWPSTVVAAGVLVASPGVDGTWSDAAPLIGQSAVYLAAGCSRASRSARSCSPQRPPSSTLFALPIAWTAIASLSFFADAAPWLDTRLALGPMPQEVMSATQWAHAGTSLALWMLLPLLIGTWRITRQEIAG